MSENTDFQPGDLVEAVETSFVGTIQKGKRYVVKSTAPSGTWVALMGVDWSWPAKAFRLVSRPNANGWHKYDGDGINPVPGMRVAISGSGAGVVRRSEDWDWGPHALLSNHHFRITAEDKEQQPVTTPIEFSKIKVGDEVTVRCKVAATNPGALRASVFDGFSGPSPEVLIRSGAIVTHIPAPPEPLTVGDRVTVLGGVVGTIMGIHNGKAAWHDAVNIYISDVSQLRRV